MAIRLQRATLYLRVDKKKKDGRMPLYVRFRRIDGEEPKFPIGIIDLLPEEWDSERQNASDPDIDLILQKEITRIRQEVRKLELEGIEIKRYCGKSSPRNKLKASDPKTNLFMPISMITSRSGRIPVKSEKAR